MNQFVIEMRASPSGSRTGNQVSGEKRVSPGVPGGVVRPAWPFLVNSSAGHDKQVLKASCSPSGFAS